MADRRQQGEDARSRVMSGQYNTPSSGSGVRLSDRAKAVRRFYESGASDYISAREDALTRSEQRTNDRVRNSRVESAVPDPLNPDVMAQSLRDRVAAMPASPTTVQQPVERHGFLDTLANLFSPKSYSVDNIGENLNGDLAPVRDTLGFAGNVVDSATLGAFPYLADKAREVPGLRSLMTPQSVSDPIESASEQQQGTGWGVAADLIGAFVPYAGAYKATAPLARMLNAGRGPIASNFVRGTLAGAAYGVADETGQGVFGENDQSLPERIRDVGINAGLGGVGDAAFSAIAPLIGRATQKWLPGRVSASNPTAEPLLLEAPRVQRRMDAAAGRGMNEPGMEPIIEPYQFGLPEATPGTLRNADNAAAARSEIDSVAAEVKALQDQYERRVVEEYQYLKRSMQSRDGVQQGQLIRDKNGDVVDRVGRQSNNPEWYQQFYRENGRTPTNRDLYTLAKDRVENGFQTELGRVPAWVEESGYREGMEAYQPVMENLQRSLREIDPAAQTTDAPLVANRLRDTRLAGREIPERQPPSAEQQRAQYAEALRNGDVEAMREIAPDVAARMEAYQERGGDIANLPSFLRRRILEATGIPEELPESAIRRATSRPARPKDPVAEPSPPSTSQPAGAGRNAPETSDPQFAEFSITDDVVPSAASPSGDLPTVPPERTPSAGAGRNAPEGPDGMRERGVVTSLAEQDKIPEAMTERLRANPNSQYQPITNEDTVNKARRAIEENAAKVEAEIMAEGPFDADKAVRAQMLIDRYNAVGNYEQAVTIADKLATEATRAGQFIQAQSLRDRLTPEGVLIRLNRLEDRINSKKRISRRKAVVSDQTKAEVMELAATAQQAQGTKNNANGVLEMLQNKPAGSKLTESEISQIETLLQDNRAFVKDATRVVKDVEPPAARQPREKRVQAALNDFFDRAEQAARDRIAARKNTLSSTPLDVWADWVVIGMAKMGRGTLKFADWSEEMVRDLGDEVAPMLRSLYDRSKEAYGAAGKRMRAQVSRKTKVTNEQHKALMDDMVAQVRDLLDDAKTGSFSDDQLQAIRDSAEELVDAMPPANRSVPDAEKAYEQSVKSLANKLAGVERADVPIDETVQEVRRLLQAVTKATNPPVPRVARGLTDVQRNIDEAGYALAGKARPAADALSAELAAYSRRADELIWKAKSGAATVDDMQEAVDVANRIAQSIPVPQRVQLDEAKELERLAKSLVRTLSDAPATRPVKAQSVQDMQRLLQTAQRLKTERTAPIEPADLTPDAQRINELARGLMERTSYKPLAPEEKAIRGFIRSKGDSLSAEQITSLQQMAEQVASLSGDARTRASQDLQKILQGIEKPSILRKISATQTIAQLLNPKTQVRNIVGNEMFYRVERLNKLVATPIDIARSKLTGADRTVTFRTNNQGRFWKAWLDGAKAGWNGVNINGLETQFELQGQAFRGKANPLTYMEKALGASLRSFDNAAYTRAYNNTMGEMATLDAINKGVQPTREYVQNYIRTADKNIQQLADDYGRYVTFQDNNVVSKSLVGLKRGLNFGQDWGLGDMVLKYPKTPGALLVRALEYSPAGFMRSAVQLAKARGHMEAGETRKFIEGLSRAVIGTIGFSGMGYALMDAGVLTTASSRDKDIRTLEQAAGKGAYQINLSALARFVDSGFDPKSGGLRKGDQLYTYDWAQPISLAFSIGSEFRKNRDEGKTADKIASGLAGAAINSVAGSLNTLTEQSVLRGLKDAAEGYPGQTVSDKVMSVLFDIPASFIPTAVNQVRQMRDNTTRETYDPNQVQQTLNMVKNRIPGLAETLPVRYDNLGEPMETYQSPSLFNILLNPGKPSTYNPDTLAADVLDLITETGDDTLAPRVPGKKVDGIPLTGEQYSRYSQIQGEQNRERLEKVDRDKSVGSQTNRTNKALDKAGKFSKNQLLREFPDLRLQVKEKKKAR